MAETLPFASALTFWPMAFQDVLRMNTAAIRDAKLSRIARHHLHEDRGHDEWFLQDLTLITGSRPDVTALFAPEHRSARSATYALVSESFRAQSDIERIVLILTFESTGHVFFPAVVKYLTRMGVQSVFQYFSQKHLDVEKGHELIDLQMQEMLGGIQIDPGTRGRCLELINRCYAAFAALFDSLERAIVDQSSATARQFMTRERLLRQRAASLASGTYLA